MTERSFDRAVRGWLESGSDRTPPGAFDAVLLAIKTTPQERDLRIPRRFTLMSSSFRILAATALVVVLGVGLVTYLGNMPGPSATSAPQTPTPAPSQAVAPTSSPPLLLDQGFSSGVFGYDAMLALGWEATLGTTRGTPTELALGEPAPKPAHFWDHFTPLGAGPVGGALLGTSTTVPPGTGEEAWIEAYQAPQVAQAGRDCIPLRSTWEALMVDGHPGAIYVGCRFVEAVVFFDGHVYLFSYTNFLGAQATVETTGRELLETFLESVSLHPERVSEPTSAPA